MSDKRIVSLSHPELYQDTRKYLLDHGMPESINVYQDAWEWITDTIGAEVTVNVRGRLISLELSRALGVESVREYDLLRFKTINQLIYDNNEQS